MEMFEYEREHLARLRPLLAECTVLLKTNGAFPLARPCSLAAYGSGVRHTRKGGTGSGEVNSRFFITAEQGLTEAGFDITTGAWLDAYDAIREKAHQQFVRRIKAEAVKARKNPVMAGMGAVMPEPEYSLPLEIGSEAAVYVLSRVCGEGNDRKAVKGDFLLTDTEVRDILALDRAYEKFMLVLNVGGPVDLTPVAGVGNILLLSQLGVETGAVLADLLLGRAVPSGKLSSTWAAPGACGSEPDFGRPDDTDYTEGIYVGYRRFDSMGRRALFPFGFGLSYTRFDVRPLSVKAEGTRITLTAAAANLGGYPGKETVQVYVSAPQGSLDKPYQELAGFAKTGLLQPGDCETVTVSFDLKDCASYDTANSVWLLEAGDYILRCGTSSVDTIPAAVLDLDGEAEVQRVRTLLKPPAFSDAVCSGRAPEALPEGVPVLTVHASEIETETVYYDTAEEILPEARALTDKELALLNTGAFDPKGGLLSIIGNASSAVCGAAGETCGLLKDRGIPALVMADGPAGLRLARQYTVDKKGGKHAQGQGMLPESVADFMPRPVQAVTRLLDSRKKGQPEDPELREQYCTAVPIGTALAQSWDPALAETCGDIVGSEMQRFGVHLWLAPALNIHRSPLCGRNFEYYSEDPLLTGRMAAAVTRGVQSHPGCGVTLKHFAANNQETNRLGNSSNLSERALREIYLKGFAVCIREARPRALMTSYNLINGVHSAHMRSLVTDWLRAECGFDGLVMTDWVIGLAAEKNGKYPAENAVPVAAAGGDLMMPGSRGDYAAVLAALKNGELSHVLLQRSASRVIRMARELTAAQGTEQ